MIAALMLAGLLVQDAEWFPVEKGTTWTYQVDGAELKVTAREKEKVGDVECVRIERAAGADATSEWYEVSKEGVLLHKLEVWRNEQRQENQPAPPVLRLKFGLKKGESWDWKGEAGQKATYTHDGEEEIEVPAGKLACVKIRCEAENPQGAYRIDRWYAKGIGVVKEVFTIDGRSRVTELVEHRKAEK